MLDQLPLEILYLIADEFSIGDVTHTSENLLRSRFVCDRPSLAPLSMTCRNLHTTLTPILFERISLRALPSFMRSLDNVEGVQRSLTIHALAGHVRRLRLYVPTWGIESSQSQMVSFLRFVLEHLPSLHTVYLSADAMVALDTEFLRAIYSHPCLCRVNVFKLEVADDPKRPLTSHPLELVDIVKLRSVSSKVFVMTAVIHGNAQAPEEEELQMWNTMSNLGIIVERLVVFEVEDSQWSKLTFAGLTSLETYQLFLPGDENTPGSIDSFIQKHPFLVEIKLKVSNISRTQRLQWASLPLTSSIFKACYEEDWEIDSLQFARVESSHQFECTTIGINRLDSSNVAQTSLTALSEACPELVSLVIYAQRSPIAVSEFLDISLDTVRNLFYPGVLKNLSFLFILWHVEEEEENEVGRKILAEGLESAMGRLSLEIGQALPLLKRVQHIVDFLHYEGSGPPTYTFSVIRSVTGEVILQSVEDDDENSDGLLDEVY